jgi:hypothetical protein
LPGIPGVEKKIILFVYNITIQVDPKFEQEWLQWQQKEHIPDIMATGMFSEWKIYHLLGQDETEGITYVIQYFADTFDNCERYLQNHAPLLREKALQRWGDRFIAFRSVMELVK